MRIIRLYSGLVYRFIVRDFVYSQDLIEKQKEELAAADTTEKELWVRPVNTIFQRRFTIAL